MKIEMKFIEIKYKYIILWKLFSLFSIRSRKIKEYGMNKSEKYLYWLRIKI